MRDHGEDDLAEAIAETDVATMSLSGRRSRAMVSARCTRPIAATGGTARSGAWPSPRTDGCGRRPAVGANPLRPPARRRAPTRWTRPLQGLAIAVAVLGFGLFVGAVPFRLEQIGALPPPALPPSAGVSPGEAERIAQVARSVAIGSLAIEGLIGLVLLVLIVVGALRRWRWAFWLALVLNGLGGLGLVMGALLGGLLLPGPGLPPPGGRGSASPAAGRAGARGRRPEPRAAHDLRRDVAGRRSHRSLGLPIRGVRGGGPRPRTIR